MDSECKFDINMCRSRTGFSRWIALFFLTGHRLEGRNNEVDELDNED